jgi:phage baseplate assembly protein W
MASPKYRDLNIFFNKNQETGDVSFSTGNSSIVQSIKNIVLTKKGERPFNQYFGTRLTDILFDSPTYAELALLRSEIRTALDSLEPRIKVNSVDILYPIMESTESSDIKINIKYVLNQGSVNTQEQTLILTVNEL